MHIGDGSYHVIVDGEGAEVIYNQAVSFLILEIWLSFAFIDLISVGNSWVKINSPYLHLMPEGDRSTAYDLDVNPTTSWAEADLSSLVPVGTLGLYGTFLIFNTDANGVLLIRDGSGTEADLIRTRSFQNNHAVGLGVGAPTLIKATNGIFDHRELSTDTEILQFTAIVWGWLL